MVGKGEGCDDSICIDKPKISQFSERITVNSLMKNTLKEKLHPQRPMYRTEYGRMTWKALHRISLNFPDNPNIEQRKSMNAFFEGLAFVFPCKECAEDFRKGNF